MTMTNTQALMVGVHGGTLVRQMLKDPSDADAIAAELEEIRALGDRTAVHLLAQGLCQEIAMVAPTDFDAKRDPFIFVNIGGSGATTTSRDDVTAEMRWTEALIRAHLLGDDDAFDAKFNELPDTGWATYCSQLALATGIILITAGAL